ncbi:MAG: hypothetical protein WC061_11245, partial [Melioribacteraceae bacterium]
KTSLNKPLVKGLGSRLRWVNPPSAGFRRHAAGVTPQLDSKTDPQHYLKQKNQQKLVFLF